MQRLTTSHLKLNSALPWDVFDSTGTLLLRKGIMVERGTQIATLLEHGLFVKTEEYRLFPSAPTPPRNQKQIDPFYLWEQLTARLSPLLRSAPQDPEFVKKLLDLVATIELLTEQSPDAALAAMILLDKNKYAAVHSLETALLCGLLARRLEWPEERRVSIVAAALTMNIGMLELQSVLARQHVPPSTTQRVAINQHPEAGVAILAKAGVTDPVWLAAVREHHESPDGGGYPHGITTMCEEALILRTSDIFSAMLAPRVVRKACSVNEAAKRCFVNEGNRKNNLTGLLFKEIGMYPPGSFVKLANGETGIAVKRGANFSAPLVYALLSSKGTPYVEPQRRDTANTDLQVVAVVPRDSVVVNLDLQKLWATSSAYRAYQAQT